MNSRSAWTLAAALVWPTASPAWAAPVTVEVWHSYTADTREEQVFLDAVAGFRAAHPHIAVATARIPYVENVAQFINAAQGGEAPDIVRISHDDVGMIGHVRVEGLPILEDLRPHLTPVQRRQQAPRAVQAMRYENALYAIPATQSCLALLYNRAVFDAAREPYPENDWTTDDLLATAVRLTRDGRYGLALPVKTSYWWFPFQSGFGGALFDANDEPTLDAPGSARALVWFQELETKRGVTAPGVTPESMKTQFIQGKAAMVFDGPWNWGDYLDAGVDAGIALLPVVAETGLRMAPRLSYHGWAVAKESAVKPQAVEVARWLTSEDVQRRFTAATYSPPTHVALAQDATTFTDEASVGFLHQAEACAPAPTIRGMALLFEPLDTALQLVYEQAMDAEEALAGANAELLAKMRE